MNIRATFLYSLEKNTAFWSVALNVYFGFHLEYTCIWHVIFNMKIEIYVAMLLKRKVYI